MVVSYVIYERFPRSMVLSLMYFVLLPTFSYVLVEFCYVS